MPDVVCSVCGACDVSGHSGLESDWRQCQRNVNMEGQYLMMTHLCAEAQMDMANVIFNI